ncbi:MAG: hypothetical protein ACM3U2_16805, partial [Deltaproteobacteria bacterium]
MPTTRRELGSVYTPQAIARRMVCACLDRWSELHGAAAGQPGAFSCRVLDPACGDGAFLLEVFDNLCRRREELPARSGDPDRSSAAAVRLGVVRNHIFGVDIDPPAVEALRAQLLKRIAPTDDLA